MTVVVGTAGHIDHGKTSLLRALTGIDADRLPEEQRRGMTIDVGYAHLRMPDGTDIDFVDVPGHDRLIGNMLVGAGEVDAAMLVVAADDGPRAQTLEHLGLLDALGIRSGLAVITKTDLVETERVAEVAGAVRMLLAETSLAGVPVLAASSATGAGVADVAAGLAALAGRLAAGGRPGPVRLAVDRVFSVKGRGVVVTGSLRGGAVAPGDVLRAEPGGPEVRVREVQVHNRPVARMTGGGRVALNVAGPSAAWLRRGVVLTAGPGIERSERLLVVLRPAAGAGAMLRHGLRVRVHAGTDQADGILDLGRRASVEMAGGRRTAIVRLDEPIAAAFGDALVVRRPSPGETLAGAVVVDPVPPRGVSRRRMTAEGIARLAEAPAGNVAQLDALLALHGVLPAERVAHWRAATGADRSGAAAPSGGPLVASDLLAALATAATDAASTTGGTTAADLRIRLRGSLRRLATASDADAATIVDRVVDGLVADGDLVRAGERLLPRGASTGPSPEQEAAMERLVRLLAVPAPPALAEAAATARCALEGIRALEQSGRIVRVEDDLAWEAETLQGLEALAVSMARAGPLSPAAFRDATGTSRRYALAILEDLDRRTVLRRTPAGHVPGPRATAVLR